jgi:hypothetical protein
LTDNSTSQHVNGLGWMGMKDPALFRRASGAEYGVIVALDRNQLTSAAEGKALKRSGLHHVSIRRTKAPQGARGQIRILATLNVVPRASDARWGGNLVSTMQGQAWNRAPAAAAELDALADRLTSELAEVLGVAEVAERHPPSPGDSLVVISPDPWRWVFNDDASTLR